MKGSSFVRADHQLRRHAREDLVRDFMRSRRSAKGAQAVTDLARRRETVASR